MPASAILQLANSAELTDEQVVTRVLKGETALFEILMRRYNQRLYRLLARFSVRTTKPRTLCKTPMCGLTST